MLALCLALIAQAPAAAQAPANYGPVSPAETLWNVATNLGQRGVAGSVAQIAWAIYRFNPDAFQGSPDRIRAGATLFVPDPAFVASVTPVQAYALVTGRAPPAPPAAPVTVAAAEPAGTAAPVAETPAPSVPGASSTFAGSPEQAELAQRLKAGQRADEIYRFLAPLEERYAGDVDFDYRLGASAFDSGRFSEAIFVLQRAVSTRPRFAGARMELARAYYALGDNESARREFTTLQAQDPPADAARVIAEYLDAIDRRAEVYEPQRGVFVELASGYDSNANGAPDTQNFLGFTLDNRNQSTASGYYSLGLGGNLSHPLGPAWRVLGDAQAGYRGNPDASFVDSQVARAGGGVEWRPGRVTLSLAPGFTYVMLDGEENHQLLAADGAATWDLEDTRVSINLRYGQQRYADALSVQDVDSLLYGASAQTTLGPRLQLVSALTLGTEEAVEDLSPFGRDLVGARVAAAIDLGNGHAVILAGSSLSSDYDGTFFGMVRTDDQIGGSLAYEWAGWRARGWSLRLQASYVDNASTVALYDYDRLDAGLLLRREFR